MDTAKQIEQRSRSIKEEIERVQFGMQGKRDPRMIENRAMNPVIDNSYQNRFGGVPSGFQNNNKLLNIHSGSTLQNSGSSPQ